MPVLGWHEAVARHSAHHLQQALVLDTAAGDLLFNHVPALGDVLSLFLHIFPSWGSNS
jgi:hypothetical protein